MTSVVSQPRQGAKQTKRVAVLNSCLLLSGFALWYGLSIRLEPDCQIFQFDKFHNLLAHYRYNIPHKTIWPDLQKIIRNGFESLADLGGFCL